jgi:hypothetical protein
MSVFHLLERTLLLISVLFLILVVVVVDAFHAHLLPPQLHLLEPSSSSFLTISSATTSATTTTFLRNDITEGDFGFQVAKQKEIIACDVTEPTAEEMALRQKDEPMFTAAVRRDLYNVLRNPYQPHQGAPAPLSWWGNEDSDSAEGGSRFGAVLLAKKSEKADADVSSRDWDSYAFTDRLAFDHRQSEWRDYTVLDDTQVLDAIARMGQATPDANAISKAFEAWLEQMAISWGDLEVSGLSVDFLIAFGNELTGRLGVSHRILSSALSDDDIKVLLEPPFVNYVRPELLEQFQLTKIEVDEEKAESTAAALWWDYEEENLE